MAKAMTPCSVCTISWPPAELITFERCPAGCSSSAKMIVTTATMTAMDEASESHETWCSVRSCNGPRRSTATRNVQSCERMLEPAGASVARLSAHASRKNGSTAAHVRCTYA